MVGQRLSHPLTAVFGAALLTVPWLGLHTVFGVDLTTGVTVALCGIAVIGASFLLAWGAETAEADVPRVFALGILITFSISLREAVAKLSVRRVRGDYGANEVPAAVED
ncbi:hypothetical protein [Haloferax sp. Atlit-12N]|uniref:hypothetical protein n=1 Tax=Haloferax sp. Atlit-12N TaxID=2077203 RepID=UPI001F33314A|nr:hypothetical protein [Haloferax sp. Atlit-12N]